MPAVYSVNMGAVSVIPGSLTVVSHRFSVGCGRLSVWAMDSVMPAVYSVNLGAVSVIPGGLSVVNCRFSVGCGRLSVWSDGFGHPGRLFGQLSFSISSIPRLAS
ncbi:hypothetical protein OYT88_16135 [Sporolactobacillus sp. CQH2019]|uniref:hypothetical protein n=1 Tax=Sporolactobacillus sp. CQH2019 TaxID=3023512 RepID=UPI00236832D5|nr:hypothetical protein [Sporolactobacillus sp. CQH2019]MDD9150072.1 hypothetical protein [Sporolactobacillus sp. CQH2019]